MNSDVQKAGNPHYLDNHGYFDELLDLIKNAGKGYARSLSTRHSAILDWIDIRLPVLAGYSVSTKCYWILHGLTDFPRCETCGRKFENHNVRLETGYKRFCGPKCQLAGKEPIGFRKYILEKRQQYPFYHVERRVSEDYLNLIFQILQSMPYVDQIRWLVENREDSYSVMLKTARAKYLVDYMLEKTVILDNSYSLSTLAYWTVNGIISWDDPRVKCKTCGKPYIGINCGKNGYQEFCCRSCAAKYEDSVQLKNIKAHGRPWKCGMDNAGHTELANRKRIETNIKNHGVEYWCNPQKILAIYENKSIKEKRKIVDTRKMTVLERYGVENYSQTDDFAKMFKDEEFLTKLRMKKNNTMRRNGTFCSSTAEDNAFNILKKYSQIL